MLRFLALAVSLATLMLASHFLEHVANPVDAQKIPRGFPGGRNKPDAPTGKAGDWYNLGPIGGKATMQKSPSKGIGSGLTVHDITSDGPAEKAGLKTGDMIIGAPKNFTANAYHELAKSIEAAEAQRKAKSAIVKLKVMRAGKEITVEVKVRHFGKDASKFPAGDMRDTIVDESLSWLAKQQQGDGGWECHLSGENGRTVMTSLCGMAFLAAGHDSGSGKYKTNVLKAAKFVMLNAGKESAFGANRGGANWNQTNWGLGYGGLFLAEANKASTIKGARDRLQEIADIICKNMESSGGFAHGPGGPNALNYLELEIVSNYCVAALGGAIANGCEVPKGKIEAALSFIEKCGGGKGGVGYSPRKGQVGHGDPGRTGGAMMAFGAVGRDNHAYYKSMKGWLQGNFRKIIDGHVSPTMHHLSAAAAAWREGGKMWDGYWDTQRQECTMLRNPDSTFTGRPTAESAQMGRNNDMDLGAVWNTAHWTIILCLENDNLPVWCGKSGKSSKKSSKKKTTKKKEKPVVTGKDKDKPAEKEKKKKEKKKIDWDKILE
ncbi:MAG: DUF6288 domain-containing protein [Planctomycetota bacterium]|jgi:hypothetical protein